MKKMNKFWTFSIWYRIQFSWLAKNYSRFNFDLSINISLFSHTYTLFLSIYRFYHAHTLGAIIYKIKRNGDTCNSVSSSHAHTYTETYCDFDANSAQFCVCVFFLFWLSNTSFCIPNHNFRSDCNRFTPTFWLYEQKVSLIFTLGNTIERPNFPCDFMWKNFSIFSVFCSFVRFCFFLFFHFFFCAIQFSFHQISKFSLNLNNTTMCKQ